MNKIEKQISIIIPAYNVQSFVIKALESIYNQKNINHDQYEVFVIDDGSTDQTATLVQEWIEQKNVNNFSLVSKINSNWGGVINYAKKHLPLSGKYISILDADDWFNENAFDEVLQISNNNPKKIDLIIANYFDYKNGKLKRNFMMFQKSGYLKTKYAFTPRSIPLCKFFERERFLASPDLREGVFYQDQLLFHNFVKDCSTIYFTNKRLGCYFISREGSSTIMEWDQRRINVWLDNMNKLLELNNPEIATYVLVMLYYSRMKVNSSDKNLIKTDPKHYLLLKKSKFYWFPFGTRTIIKTFYLMSLKKNIK